MVSRDMGILFCDICDSSSLYVDHGPIVASELIQVCLATMIKFVEACGGSVIDQIGDEVFCQFDNCDAMALCARQLVEVMGSRFVGAGGSRVMMQVRVGFYFGNVFIQGDKRYGDTVHMAKRMIDLAKPMQILSTAGVLDRLTSEQFFHRHVNDYVVKGSARREQVHELLWEQAELTLVAPGLSKPSTFKKAYLLSAQWQKTIMQIGPDRPKITIGRAPQSDICVTHPKVSRLHGQIEYRADGFYYTDMSTNGTSVKHVNSQAETVVHQNQILISEGHQLQLVAEAPTQTMIIIGAIV